MIEKQVQTLIRKKPQAPQGSPIRERSPITPNEDQGRRDFFRERQPRTFPHPSRGQERREEKPFVRPVRKATSPDDLRELFVTVAKGLENFCLTELQELGLSDSASMRVKRGGVELQGTLKDAYKICLHSRVASRVLMPVHRFEAPTPERLYGGVKAIRWSEHLTPEKTIAVDFVTQGSQITHTQYGAQKTKDAICDQMVSVQGARPSVDLSKPDVRVSVYVLQDIATVAIDLSGESLHRRGYREEGVQGPAPLKESLAAGILLAAGWPALVKEWKANPKSGLTFLDPLCGSGSLLIEAAWIAAGVPAGCLRRRFGFHGWNGHQEDVWKAVKAEAQTLVTSEEKLETLRIFGFDESLAAVRLAKAHVENAGLDDLITIERRALKEWEAQPDWTTPTPRGLVGCNPPYGERLGEEEALVMTYRSLGDLYKKRFSGWRGFIFTGSELLSKEVGLKSKQRVPLFNGAIECRVLNYEMWLGSKNPMPSEPGKTDQSS